MSDPFIGEIRMFAGTFAPLHWSICGGQLINTSSNQALFALLGTIYGGDGRTTFALPEMRGRLPLHRGTGPGLTQRIQGQRFGFETVKLASDNVPSHTHTLRGSNNSVTANVDPTNQVTGIPEDNFYSESVADKMETLAPQAVANTGANLAHRNVMPLLAVNFIIALLGVFPSRS